MELTPPLKDCLQYLFQSYLENSNEIYDISAVAKRHGADPIALAAQLRTLGLIRDDARIEGDEVKCAISVEGINAAKPGYIDEKMLEAVKGLGEANSIANVASLLNMDQQHFQQSFDVANEMQNRDLVKLLYAFQPRNTVNVEVTLEGVRARKTGRLPS